MDLSKISIILIKSYFTFGRATACIHLYKASSFQSFLIVHIAIFVPYQEFDFIMWFFKEDKIVIT